MHHQLAGMMIELIGCASNEWREIVSAGTNMPAATPTVPCRTGHVSKFARRAHEHRRFLLNEGEPDLSVNDSGNFWPFNSLSWVWERTNPSGSAHPHEKKMQALALGATMRQFGRKWAGESMMGFCFNSAASNASALSQ